MDHNNLVYMDSDSNDSDRLRYSLHMQDNLRQEVIDSGEDTLDGLDNNPMHVTVKREKECIIEDVPIGLDKTDDIDESIISQSDQDAVNSPDHSYYAIIETIREHTDVSIEAKNSLDVKLEYDFTRLDPPVGMCLPPDVSEFIEEEQFAIIANNDDDIKKTEEESAAKDTSLVDHQYSQPEATNREFCDDIVQSMLQESGNDKNPAVLTLLSKFTEIFEHFVDEDKNSQMSLYISSMKKTLKVLKIDEPSTSAAAATQLGPSGVDLCRSSVELSDDLEVMRKTIDEVVDLADVVDLDEIIDIPATQPADEPANNPANDKANEMDEEISISTENENVVQHKINLTKVNDFALKLSGNVTDLMNSPLISNESVVEGKKSLLTLVKESRKEFRRLILEIKSESVKAENEINEKSKNNLINKILESSEWSNTESESDADQVVNLNRKIPKSGPQTPAIVSSTKEDSEISETEAAKAATTSRSSSPESGTGKENIEKQIEKLLDFSTLACPKPASSKKISKPKKIKKLKKKRSSDIDSFLESSDSESVANQMSSSESERETSDEEQQMLMRQNADIKNSLLAGSSSDSDFSDRGVLSSSDASDSEPTPKKKEKSEKKVESPVKLPVDEAEAGSQVQDKANENNVETLKLSATPAVSPKLPADKANVQNGQADQTVTVDSDEEVAKETEQQQQPRKYIKRDSFEREIFSKDFLETNGNKRKATSPGTSSSGATTPKTILKTAKDEESASNPQGTIDVSMFDGRRTNKEIDLQKMIDKREKNLSAPSTSSSSNAKPPPVQTTNDDEWISLSSDSDSEVSAPNAGSSPRMPRRKKMLTEEELQEETKRANKEETQRVKRLEKKNEALTQMLSERLGQDDEMQDEVILDYDSKTQTTIAVHPKLVTFLKNHQKEGIKFMYDTCYGSIADEVKTESGCILAHCMGLGKTLQLITLLHTLIMHPKQLKTKKVLVVCPKSTIMNWNEEFRKWLDGIDTNSLKVYYLDDQKLPERVRIIKQWYDSDRPGVFLINYEALRYMVNYSGSKRSTIQQPEHEVTRLQEIIAKCLLTPGPDLVVCDEGHLIKNQTGATNKAITKIDTRRRIILTGTPVQNNLNEYYAMVDWIKPALLGTVKEFNNLYANPIKDGQCKDSTAQDIKRMKQRSFILNRKLSKFVQRKEATVLKEFLPEKYEYCIFVPLTNVQEQLYEKFLRKFNKPRVFNHN